MQRVLIVYKKSAYQIYVLERRDPRLLQLLRSRHPDALELRKAHHVHEATLRAVVDTLKRLPARCDLVYRAHLKSTSAYDLVVTVGGDGTFLQASHAVLDVPILGVNADASRSEAVFCAATARTVGPLLRRALAGPPAPASGRQAGRLPSMRLSRLQVAVNGRRLSPLALNDVLITHDNPATMSRYRLRVGRRVEDHKSSGVWIASAAGSSSAVLAAGGTRLPWGSTRFQYRARELYRGRLSRPRLVGGVLPGSSVVEITWLMRTGLVCVDGPHVAFPLRFGDRVRISRMPRHPLKLLMAPTTRR